MAAPRFAPHGSESARRLARGRSRKTTLIVCLALAVPAALIAGSLAHGVPRAPPAVHANGRGGSGQAAWAIWEAGTLLGGRYSEEPIRSMLMFVIAVFSALLETLLHKYQDVSGKESFQRHRLPQSERVKLPGGKNAHVLRWSSAAVRDGRSPARLTVVCIHGLADSSHSFVQWAQALVAQADLEDGTAVEVLALDLPGLGLTGPWTPSQPTGPCAASLRPYSREADVAFVREVLENAGILERGSSGAENHERPRLVLVGHSIGGAIAASFAATYPTDVDALVLACPWGLEYRSIRPEEYWSCSLLVSLAFSPCVWPVLHVLFCVMRYVTPLWVLNLVVPTAFGRTETVLGPARQREIAQRYHAMMLRKGNRQALHTRIAGMVDEERHAEEFHQAALQMIGSLRCPVQLQWGSLDEWLPVSRAAAWVDAVQAFSPPDRSVDLRILPMAGHCLHEQVPLLSAEAAWAHASRAVVS